VCYWNWYFWNLSQSCLFTIWSLYHFSVQIYLATLCAFCSGLERSGGVQIISRTEDSTSCVGKLCHYATTTTVLQFSGFCPGQPWWVGTKRNINTLTPIVDINHPLSASSIYYDPWHPPCSIYMPDSVFPQSLSKFSLVYLLAWTIHFILHTFFHPVIVFFSQHMPIQQLPW